jgi:hypothetical protein
MLLLVFLYFAFRRLGSFPAAWADDSLFMLVAKMVAEGRGYVLPILGYDWAHPYILAVGPTLIYPVALAIKIGGFSVAAARLPMVLFLLGSLVVSYLYVLFAFDRTTARWNAALLISLSAFINTGKPVLGEIPGFFFLMLGFFIMRYGRRTNLSACAGGAAFGLAIVTKLPYGLILPALALPWCVALCKRDRKEFVRLSIVAATAVAVLIVGMYWLGGFDGGFLREIRIFLFERRSVTETISFEPIYSRPSDMLRIVYGHYLLIALLALIGWRNMRKNLRRSDGLTIAALIVLFALYFLNGPGWYRALLPSTLLLFLFVPAAARSILGQYGSAVLLTVIVLMQGVWQADYRGSSPSPGAALAAQALEEKWTQTRMVILQSEVFVRLPQNPNWLFLSEELRNESRQPAAMRQRIKDAKCLPVLKRASREEFNSPPPNATHVSDRYFLFAAPSDCKL